MSDCDYDCECGCGCDYDCDYDCDCDSDCDCDDDCDYDPDTQTQTQTQTQKQTQKQTQTHTNLPHNPVVCPMVYRKPRSENLGLYTRKTVPRALSDTAFGCWNTALGSQLLRANTPPSLYLHCNAAVKATTPPCAKPGNRAPYAMSVPSIAYVDSIPRCVSTGHGIGE
eukprot:646162-Rhodomonas_salina.2